MKSESRITCISMIIPMKILLDLTFVVLCELHNYVEDKLSSITRAIDI